MERTALLMFELIKSEICNTSPDMQNFGKIGDEDFEKLYILSSRHDLAHLLRRAFVKNNLQCSDRTVFEKYEKQYAVSIFRYENISRETERIKSVFEDGKVPFIPLKGAVIRELYPDPRMRMSCDIDILVHEEDLDRAIELLKEKAEYTTDGVLNFHDVSLFSPGGVHTELHFCIKENDEKPDRLLSKVWDYAEKKSEDSFEYLLKPEFLIFYLIAHAAHHFSAGGCGIRPFIDLFVLKREIEYDEKEVLKLCEIGGLDNFYKAAKKVSAVWFENEKTDELTEKFTKYVLYGGVYGNCENRTAAGTHAKGGKFAYIMSRIFMPYDSLKLSYPKLKNHKILLPFYEICRWFRLFTGGRLKNSLYELKTVKNLSEESSEEISSLIEELKL